MKKNVKLVIGILGMILFVIFFERGYVMKSDYDSRFVPEEVDCVNIVGYPIVGATCYTESDTAPGWVIFALLGFISLFLGLGYLVSFVFDKMKYKW